MMGSCSGGGRSPTTCASRWRSGRATSSRGSLDGPRRGARAAPGRADGGDLRVGQDPPRAPGRRDQRLAARRPQDRRRTSSPARPAPASTRRSRRSRPASTSRRSPRRPRRSRPGGSPRPRSTRSRPPRPRRPEREVELLGVADERNQAALRDACRRVTAAATDALERHRRGARGAGAADLDRPGRHLAPPRQRHPDRRRPDHGPPQPRDRGRLRRGPQGRTPASRSTPTASTPSSASPNRTGDERAPSQGPRLRQRRRRQAHRRRRHRRACARSRASARSRSRPPGSSWATRSSRSWSRRVSTSPPSPTTAPRPCPRACDARCWPAIPNASSTSAPPRPPRCTTSSGDQTAASTPPPTAVGVCSWCHDLDPLPRLHPRTQRRRHLPPPRPARLSGVTRRHRERMATTVCDTVPSSSCGAARRSGALFADGPGPLAERRWISTSSSRERPSAISSRGTTRTPTAGGSTRCSSCSRPTRSWRSPAHATRGARRSQAMFRSTRRARVGQRPGGRASPPPALHGDAADRCRRRRPRAQPVLLRGADAPRARPLGALRRRLRAHRRTWKFARRRVDTDGYSAGSVFAG